VVDGLKQAASDVAECGLKVEQEVEALQTVTLLSQPTDLGGGGGDDGRRWGRG